MTPERQQRRYISIEMAVRRSGLSEELVQECVMREIVADPLTDGDLCELRRVRRLQELGVNLQGIEVILHMRQQIQSLRAEMERLQRVLGPAMWGQLTWGGATGGDIEAEWRRLPPAIDQDRNER
ncbi:MAG: hypothetical protein JXA93_15675 [Anaerolineae bacterium]|nr:hypothetical protein [Anaerolineae bacterium]